MRHYSGTIEKQALYELWDDFVAQHYMADGKTRMDQDDLIDAFDHILKKFLGSEDVSQGGNQ